MSAALLDSLAEFLARFVSYPSKSAHVAHSLWIAHTHAMERWDSTPRIAFLSPEPASGKTRALEVTALLTPRPVESVNCTPAYIFRKISDEAGPPTLLFDEVDTVFGPRAKKDNEDLRGILNAGHRKGATAGRCVIVGKEIRTEELPAYCAVALAGLGDLPDTLLSRSVIVRMRRRAPTELVEPFRRREQEWPASVLLSQLQGWGEQLVEKSTFPVMPSGISDRAADVWESLIAVADDAGGRWPALARVSAVALVADSIGGSPSLGMKLLSDLKYVFGNAECLSTAAILEELHLLEEAPWGDLRGKPLDSRGLARLLSRYGVTPRTVRTGNLTPKGYTKQSLHDAWVRYVGVGDSAKGTATSATTATVAP